jgi:hypothetical protein
MTFGAFKSGLGRILGASAIGVGGVLLLSSPARCADEQAKPATDEAAVVEAPGFKAYRDATGKIVSAPPANAAPLAMSAAEKNSASTSSDGLHEEAVATGGYKVDLQGRFQSPMLGKTEEDGKVATYHPHPFAITKTAE